MLLVMVLLVMVLFLIVVGVVRFRIVVAPAVADLRRTVLLLFSDQHPVEHLKPRGGAVGVERAGQRLGCNLETNLLVLRSIGAIGKKKQAQSDKHGPPQHHACGSRQMKSREHGRNPSFIQSSRVSHSSQRSLQFIDTPWMCNAPDMQTYPRMR